MTLLSIVGALLVLTVLVFVHELGHFYAGKKLGFRIDEFAIGMGPVVCSKEKNGTRFAIRALPIGGLCAFHGEDEGVSDPECFNAQPVWKRMIVVLAGPFMNILLAVVLAVIILMTYGEYMPMINDFTAENTPAEAAGIQVGDIITEIDGKSITYYAECTDYIQQADPARIEVTVRRDGMDVTLTARDIYDPESGSNRLGIYISPERLRYGLLEAATNSVRYTCYIVKEMFKVLGGLFTGSVTSDDVAGPVGTISIIGQAVRAGFEVVLRLGVLISINLGIMNILPIPALDGWRLFLLAGEGICKRKLPDKAEWVINAAGLALLLLFMCVVTFSDITKLFS